jgi:hypothetical protein
MMCWARWGGGGGGGGERGGGAGGRRGGGEGVAGRPDVTGGIFRGRVCVWGGYKGGEGVQGGGDWLLSLGKPCGGYLVAAEESG